MPVSSTARSIPHPEQSRETDPALLDVLALSEEMLAHARSAAWEALAEVEQVRRERLNRYFLNREPGQFPRSTVDILRKVIDADRKIVDLVESGKAEFARQARRLSEGRKAQSAYNSHSR